MGTYRILGAIVALVAVAFGVLPAAALNWDEITNIGRIRSSSRFRTLTS